MNDEQIGERRRIFLTQRLAGATFSQIAAKYTKDTGVDISATTVRKDVDIARSELVDGATRDVLRGEHRGILLDMRKANYPAMASGDIDAAKIVMSTLVREAEMFGLDDPKRTVVGVGTDVEFANDLVGLITAVGFEAPPDLVFAARGERTVDSSRDETPALVQPTTLDVEVVDDSNPFVRPAEPDPEPAPAVDAAWSNL